MVEFILGKREQISYAEEHTYGTATTPSVVLAREATFEPRDAQNFVEIRGAGTDTVTIDEREQGIKTAGGTLEFAPQDWRWLRFVICDGSSDVVDTDQTTYQEHYFNNSMDVAPFTLERAMQLVDNEDHVLTYEGCQVNRCTITFDAGEGEGGGLVKVSLDVLAEDVSAGTSVTSLATPTTNAFQFRNAKLMLNALEVTELKGGTINIENNLHDARYANYTNNRLKGESAVTIRRYNGTFRILTGSSRYYALWDTGTVIATTSISLTRGTNDDITIPFNDFKIESVSTPTNLDGINEVTLNWVAKDTGSIVVKDAITAY